jgi:hypothetical protein
MIMRAFLFILLLLPAQAFASAVVLMVNMNYSSSELKAAQDMAAARGQRVEMVPPQSMVATAEALFEERDHLQEKLETQFPEESPLTLKSAVAGIMREGSNWHANPAIARFVGSAQMDSLSSATLRFADMEKQNGEMIEQLRRKAIQLEARGDRVDSMILSSHSDGSNLTGETSLHLSANDLAHLREEQPAFFDNARHVLLLGCYNMTKPNHRAWRYDLFPHASMLAGFGIKAPSRYDDTSPNYIRQTMTRGQQLDERMAATGTPLDPGTLERAFKALDTFTTDAHPGVIDYCYSVVEGKPGTWTRDCDTQWKDLYQKKAMMHGYWSLVDPREDPPTVSGGELRTFYNTLQGTCPAWEANSEKNDWQASERMRISLRENVIRLIFWWNVQHNFSTYYADDIAAMNRRLIAAGVRSTMPSLDGTSSRVDFVAAYRAADSELRAKDPATARRFEALYGPLFFLKGEDTVAEGEKLTVESTLARGAIPFNWIEGTTVLGRR